MDKKQKDEKADNIINIGVAAGVGGAAIPLPVADSVAITSAQVTMLYALSRVYEREVGKDTLKALVLALAGAKVGEWLWSLVKVIPGLGTAVGIVGQMSIAGSVTYVIGKAGKELFASGKVINKENFKEIFSKKKKEASSKEEDLKSKFEKNKELIEQVNFHPESTEFDKKLTFYFNLEGIEDPELEIMHESVEVTETYDLKGIKSQKTIDFSDMQSGTYFATLRAKNLPDLGLTVEKI